MKFSAIVGLLLLTTVSAWAQRGASDPFERRVAPSSAEARVGIENAGDRGLTLVVSGLKGSARQIGGQTVISHNALRYSSTVDPIPSMTFTIGIPADATDITATLGTTSAEQIPLVLVPADTALYRPTGPTLAVGTGSVTRGIRTVTLRYRPMTLNGATLVVQNSARINVSWKRSGRGVKGDGGYTEIPAMERTLRSLIVNYDQARAWRTTTTPSARLSASGDWGIGQAAVLLAPRDGLYRITLAELKSAGVSDIDGAQIDRLNMTNRRAAVPFYVDDRGASGIFDGDDAIEFVGARKPGEEGTYFDDVTDTNAYVLTWRGLPGARRLAARDGKSTGEPTLIAYDSTLHFEQENDYFPGLTLNQGEGGHITTIHVAERVPHERYYWKKMINNSQEFLPFDCSPAYEPGAVVTLRLRIANATDRATRLNVALNTFADLGTVEVEGFRSGRGDSTFTFTVPVNYLINGRNVLKLLTSNPDNEVHEIYIDYFELEGEWMPSTFDDVAKFRIPKGGPGKVRVSMTGMTRPVEAALTQSTRVTLDSQQAGYLFRLSSRQFVEDGLNPLSTLRQMSGFVAEIAGTVRLGSDGAGLYLAIVAPNGTVRTQRQFATYTDPGSFAAALSFLDGVGAGEFLLAGFAVGFWDKNQMSAQRATAEQLRSRLVGMGARSLAGVDLDDLFVASWAMAVRGGAPATAIDMLIPGTRGVALNAFIPAEGGNSYRAMVTVEGEAHEEIVMGASATPGLRYHPEDKLVAESNQAELIIISHPKFMAESERLAAHRRRHGPAEDTDFSVRVVDIHTIYDEFNDGVKSPTAIRRFLQYADSSWTDPKPGYVLLFGDASWDAAQRLPQSTMIDYIPTYGIPASDYIYTVPFGGTNPDSPLWRGDTATTWQQFIGRLPATSEADARAMVDKIIDYDTLPPAHWNNRFVFMSGGANERELSANKRMYQRFAEDYIVHALEGDTALVYRTTPPKDLPQPDTRDAPWARSEINKGALMVSFSGHGATDVFDLDFGYPENLDNQNRYFVLGTYSCQTGAFGQPDLKLRNERFLTYPEKGAIAAIGATGFSWSHLNEFTQEEMFIMMVTEPYMNNLGALVTLSKYKVFQDNGGLLWENTHDGFMLRNHIMMYSLLGDPSMDMRLSRSPELALPGDYAFVTNQEGKEPTVRDSIAVVHVRLSNYGKPLEENDSVVVVATITDRTGKKSEVWDTVYSFNRFAEITFKMPLNREPGEYTIRVEADPYRMIAESYRPDNVLVLQSLRVRGNQALTLEPISFGRVEGYDNVMIRLLNPPSGPGAEIVVDTVASFDSPARFSSKEVGTMNHTELTTSWTFSIPQGLRSTRKFWWRAVATTGDPVIAQLFPLVETFTVEPDPAGAFRIGGIRQMASAQLTDLVNEEVGVGPGFRSVPIEIHAIGQSKNPINDREFGNDLLRIRIGDVADQIPDGLGRAGINIVVLDRTDLRVLAQGNFPLWRDEPSYVTQFLNFIQNDIPTGQIVLLATEGSTLQSLIDDPRRQEMIDALESLGSTVADSLGFEDSYALIGGKGIDPSQVHEAWVGGDSLKKLRQVEPYYALVTVRDTFTAVPKGGRMVTPTIGPATAWRTASLDLTSGAAVMLTAIGIRRDGVRDTLLRDQPANTSVDLSSIDARVYPRIALMTEFANDQGQRLRELAVDFDPSPELAIVPSTFHIERDSVLQGDPVKLNATVVNLSRTHPADGVLVRLKFDEVNQPTPIEEMTIGRIGPLDSARTSFTLRTDRIGGHRRFAVIANPLDAPAEPYRDNNEQATELRIGYDSVAPKIIIFADGEQLMEGDFVRPGAQFEIRILDNSLLDIDSSKTRLTLDNDILTIENTGAEFRRIASGEHRASFYYQPPAPLQDGEHGIFLETVDATGNKVTSELTFFFVEGDLRLSKVINFPNPFVNKTAFTFMVSGSTVPRVGEIGIFTVAGRKIRTIPLTAADLRIGFNKVDWNGRDEDGDEIANGVYLYRVMVDDGEAKQEALEKLVIMR